MILNEEVESLRSLPLKAFGVLVLDVICTAVLWVVAGYNIGIWNFLTLSCSEYHWTSSLLDVVVVSIVRPFILGFLMWRVRSLHFTFWHRAGLILCNIIPLAFVSTKVAFIVHEEQLQKLYGIVGVNIATLSVCLAAPLLELLICLLMISKDNHVRDSGYSLIFADEKTSFEAHTVIERELNIAEGEKHASVGRITKLAVPEIPLIMGGMTRLVIFW